jgi:branched-chain amino acid transport system ATP-binding protein
MTTLLHVDDLVVRYGTIEALHGVSLSVGEGRIAALIGANGAGKTTILRAISGLVRPASGSVQFRGASIVGLAPHKIVRQGVSHVPEGRGIFANLSVLENLKLGGYPRHDQAGVSSDQARTLELFPRLRERLNQNAGTLSGGEQQMLAIARALLARPKLLLLDEPSLGLAPQIVQTIFQIIREINNSGTTILLVEQNAHMALAVAHDAWVLEVGEIAMHGPAAELAKSDEVREAYLGVA